MKLSGPAARDGSLNWFVELVDLADSLVDKVGVLLAVNVQGKTQPLDDYQDGDSIVSEFLTGVELNDFVEGFELANIYCQTVLDEEGFLQWLARDRGRFPRAHPLVYSLAQNGTGPARLGLIPGLCRLQHVPLVDSDGYGVIIAQNKFHSLSILRQHGLPAARSWWFTATGWWPCAPPHGLKLIAKLTHESASLGMGSESVFIMDRNSEISLARVATRYRQPLTVQEFVPGFEIEVPVFDADEPRTIMAVGIESNGSRNLGSSVLSYDRVAIDEYGFYDFGDENSDAATEMMKIARESFRGLGLKGVGRVDFRLSSEGPPTIIEVNCKPHLTKHSSFCHAVMHIGGSYSDLLRFLVGAASFRSGITR